MQSENGCVGGKCGRLESASGVIANRLWFGLWGLWLRIYVIEQSEGSLGWPAGTTSRSGVSWLFCAFSKNGQYLGVLFEICLVGFCHWKIENIVTNIHISTIQAIRHEPYDFQHQSKIKTYLPAHMNSIIISEH